MKSFSIVLSVLALFVGNTTQSMASFDVFTTPAEATQTLSLPGLGVPLSFSLTGTGFVEWHLDVDGSGNSIGSGSFIVSDFQGTLPGSLGPLGGTPFDLYSLNDGQQTVTSTGGGTVVTVTTNFELDVPAAGLQFYTTTPSVFATSVAGIPFQSFFARAPNFGSDKTDIYLQGVPVPVGQSFDRTVSSVPEPSSLALLGLGGFGLAFNAYRRRRAVAN